MDESRNIFCPAKLNLSLHVNGLTTDRFHEITSLVVRIDFGDRIHVRFLEDTAAQDVLLCDVGEVPVGGENTILRALSLFRRAVPFHRRLEIVLEKNIPLRSGLGGGSCDGAFFLQILNRMLGSPMEDAALLRVAALVGRDCPLFLGPSPCLVGGSGEIVEDVEGEHFDGLRRSKFLLFKPNFGVDTAWAYENFDRCGAWALVSRDAAKSSALRLAIDLRKGCGSSHYHNVLQDVVVKKFMELQLVLNDLQEYFNLRAHMTGSGSACYVPLDESFDSKHVVNYLKEVLGNGALIREVRPIIDRPSPSLPI